MKQAQTVRQKFNSETERIRQELEALEPMAEYVDTLTADWYEDAKIRVFDNGGPFATIDLLKTPRPRIQQILRDIKRRVYLDLATPTKIADQLTDHKSPFRFAVENGIRTIETRISFWIHLPGDQLGQIWVAVPLNFYSDDIIGHGYRKVFDTQKHYFPGMSDRKIKELEIPSAWLDLFERINWYGGNKDTLVTNQEDVEEYEHVIFNGHTPEFTEFWTNTLREHEK